MLDDQESHAAQRRNCSEQLRDRLESPCRCADSHYGEGWDGFFFFYGDGCHRCSCDAVQSSHIRRLASGDAEQKTKLTFKHCCLKAQKLIRRMGQDIQPRQIRDRLTGTGLCTGQLNSTCHSDSALMAALADPVHCVDHSTAVLTNSS